MLTADLARAARSAARIEGDAAVLQNAPQPGTHAQHGRRTRAAPTCDITHARALASASLARSYAVGMPVHAFRSRAGHRRDAPVTLGLLLANLVFPA
ncbi:hypothetical protein [Xanthomonas indica]|uniref:Uncharacterized protein n=1 Tax=Xanthomonas indica TaxID=2912242 RepID=A0AAU8I8I4_9XANT|nr:hypothetical protein [Xanthomonas indica]MCI2262227.1 hypothetical protein [Xanthomonas indica]